MDHGRGPAFRRGMELAHTVCAAVAAGALARTEAGQRLRKAAVSVPSLVEEAFVDLAGADAAKALSQASARLSEVADLLSLEPVRQSFGEPDRTSLIAEIEALRADLEALRGSRTGAAGHA
jgi:four helix bundle protein